MPSLMKAPAASVWSCGWHHQHIVISLCSPAKRQQWTSRATCGTVALEAIKDRQQHLANGGTLGRQRKWREKGSKKRHKKWNRELLIITLSGYYRLAVSTPLVPRWNVGVKRKVEAG